MYQNSKSELWLSNRPYSFFLSLSAIHHLTNLSAKRKRTCVFVRNFFGSMIKSRSSMISLNQILWSMCEDRSFEAASYFCGKKTLEKLKQKYVPHNFPLNAIEDKSNNYRLSLRWETFLVANKKRWLFSHLRSQNTNVLLRLADRHVDHMPHFSIGWPEIRILFG